MVKVRDILNIVTYLCVVTAYASVVSYVQIYSSIGFVTLLVLSVYLDCTRIARIPHWALNSISVLVLSVSILRINPEDLVEPVLDALIILVAIKLLEDKRFRDYMQIYAICIFLLIGSSLISLSIVFLAYFTILATLSTLALMLLAYFSQDPEMLIRRDNLTKILTCSTLICSISIPASILFFIILPRTNYPLFSFLNKSGFARSGFSDQVALGGVADIQEDNSVIFRAEMQRVADSGLYWRGVVLDHFDGSLWKSTIDGGVKRANPIEGAQIVQTIYLEPYGDRYLFALDKPASISLHTAKRFGLNPVVTRHPGSLTYSLRDHLYERIRYKATSVFSQVLPEDGIDREKYLQLPADFSPRIKELQTSLAANGDEAELIQDMLQFIKWGDFKYSMENLPVSDTPLEDFLFLHRHGNCEYFASSLAVMLRAAGIPSRLVGGYRGGYYNNAGRYYMVLQKNAHVWVEAYVGNQGWIRLDPTPYASESPSEAYEKSLYLQTRLLLDTFNYYWNRLVINYDVSRQLEILNKIRSGFKKPDLKLNLDIPKMKKYAVTITLVLLLSALACRVLVKRKSPHDKLLAKFLKKMSRYGYDKSSSEGLEEFIERVDSEELRERASRFVVEFEEIYYKDTKFTNDRVSRLESSIRSL